MKFFVVYWYITVKTNPNSGGPIPVLGIKANQRKRVISLFLKLILSTFLSIKLSRRDLSIDTLKKMG